MRCFGVHRAFPAAALIRLLLIVCTFGTTCSVLMAIQVGAAGLSGWFESKQGPRNARIWTFRIGNNGAATAAGVQLDSLQFTQTRGAACTPVTMTTFPVVLGSIAAGTSSTAAATIDFTSCPNTATFTVLLRFSANGGAAAGTVLRNNSFR